MNIEDIDVNITRINYKLNVFRDILKTSVKYVGW